MTTDRKHQEWKRKLRKVLRRVREQKALPWQAACKVRLIYDEFAHGEIEAGRWKPYHTQIIMSRWEDRPHGASASKSLRYWAEPFKDWRIPAKFFACKLFWQIVEAIELLEAWEDYRAGK